MANTYLSSLKYFLSRSSIRVEKSIGGNNCRFRVRSNVSGLHMVPSFFSTRHLDHDRELFRIITREKISRLHNTSTVRRYSYYEGEYD